MLAIGPYHHYKDHSSAFEKHKIRYLHTLVNRTGIHHSRLCQGDVETGRKSSKLLWGPISLGKDELCKWRFSMIVSLLRLFVNLDCHIWEEIMTPFSNRVGCYLTKREIWFYTVWDACLFGSVFGLVFSFSFSEYWYNMRWLIESKNKIQNKKSKFTFYNS